MIIKKLEVSGLRAFKQASFEFKPGMNLLVGVNGVGKTTVLDAIRICLSKILSDIKLSRNNPLFFELDDIKIGFETLQINFDFDILDEYYQLLIHKQREEFKEKTLNPDDKLIETPSFERLTPLFSKNVLSLKKSKSFPLAVYYPVHRSIISEKNPSKTSTKGGQYAALAESLLETRFLNIIEIADWFNAQEELAKENPATLKHIMVLSNAISRFLPECSKLNVVSTQKGNRLFIDKEGVSLNLDQLSEGERGVISLVLDLAKRLSQANPGLDDPINKGQAIVLIDELDLHLHPKWQRTIVENLTKTFPNCQFIASTHSPQIIPSVEPENILLIKENRIIRPDRSLGMDSNWILRILMETNDRPEFSAKAIESVEKLIEKGKLEEALKKIERFVKDGLDIQEWPILRTRIARFKSL